MTIGLNLDSETPEQSPKTPTIPPKLAQDSLKTLLRVTGMITVTGGGGLLLSQTLIQPQAEIDLSTSKETHASNNPSGQTIARSPIATASKPLKQPSSARQWGSGFQNSSNETVAILPISQPEVITLRDRPNAEALEDLQIPEDPETKTPTADSKQTLQQPEAIAGVSNPEEADDASETEEDAKQSPATSKKITAPDVVALFPQPTVKESEIAAAPTSSITPPDISLNEPTTTKPSPQNPISISIATPIPVTTPTPTETPVTKPETIAAPSPIPATPQPQSSPMVKDRPEVIAMVPQTTGIPKIAGAFVENFKVTGSSIFSEAKLNQIASSAIQPDSETPGPINRVLSPAELVQASEAITKLYTDGKYINSGAYVPQEVLQGATPEIKVVEGSVEKFNINIQPATGFGLNLPLRKSYIESRLAQATTPPLNLDRLLEATKLLESDPLIGRISVKLEPGNQIGGSILNAEVQQAKSFSSEVNLGNGRSQSVGSFQQGVTLRQANLLGLGDQLSVSYDRSKGSHSGNFGYTLPLNAKDGSLSFRYSANGNRIIEERFSDLDITSSSKLYEIKLRQPLVRKPNSEFALSLSGTHYRSENQILGDQPLPGRGSDDGGLTRITALRFGQEFLHRDAKQVFALQSQVSFGVKALGATINEEGPDGRFISWRGQGQYARLLGPDSLFSLRGQVQFADRGLAPVEQMSLGGADTVRGYRPNSLLTDNGWLTSAELRLPIARFPKSKTVLQLAPFFDMGGGWNRDGEAVKPGVLMSTGMGLVLRIGNQFSGRIDYGIPLTSTDRNGQSLRQNGIHFSLSYSL
jgi:hemolysin activation/secretion protein